MSKGKELQKSRSRSGFKHIYLLVRRNLDLFVIFLWSLFWRFYGANLESLHVDEFVQANGISPSLLETWAHSRYLGMPPIDMTIQWIAVSFFGYSNSVIRSVPILLGALSCAVLTITIRNYSSKKLGVLAGLIAGVIPQFIFTQQTVRPYSLFVLTVGLAFLFASGPWSSNFKPLISVLIVLPWTRSLEGPISTTLFILILLVVIRVKKSNKIGTRLPLLMIPAISVIGSVFWTSSTEITILGPPGSSLNNLEEVFKKIQTLPALYLSDTSFMFGRNFTALTIIMAIFTLIFNFRKINKFQFNMPGDENLSIFPSFGFFTIAYLANSIAIFTAVNALTRLPHADRYFALGMLGLVSLFVYLLFRLNYRSNLGVKMFSIFIILLLIGQYTLSAFAQAHRTDKTQYDQINRIIAKDPSEFIDTTVAYLPGEINQYIPGWPSSVGQDNQPVPTWVTFLLRDFYSQENVSFETLSKLDNVVLLPSVDQRGSLLIREGWRKEMFNNVLAPNKRIYIHGGAFVLKDLSNLEFVRVLEIVAKERFENSDSQFWIDALLLTLADGLQIKVNVESRERFCSRIATKFQIDSGNTFGNWGQGAISTDTFFYPLSHRICLSSSSSL